MIYPSKLLVVLVSGKAGVGKSTFSKKAEEYFSSFGLNPAIVSFASVLKSVARLLTWDGEKDSKGRTFLQELGRTARNYNKDVWVKLSLVNRVPDLISKGVGVVLVDDWRFLNEYGCLKGEPGIQVYTVRIEAPLRESLLGKPEYWDESETSLPCVESDDNLYDFTVDNSGNLFELNTKVESVVKYIIDHCEKWGK